MGGRENLRAFIRTVTKVLRNLGNEMRVQAILRLFDRNQFSGSDVQCNREQRKQAHGSVGDGIRIERAGDVFFFNLKRQFLASGNRVQLREPRNHPAQGCLRRRKCLTVVAFPSIESYGQILS